MGRPNKRFRRDINLFRPKTANERVEELMKLPAQKGGFLPKGVTYEDMDQSFKEFIEKKMELSLGGKKVPAIFLTIQRWAEFAKTWEHSDKFKNIEIPFISIVRKPDVQVGTNLAGVNNIPGQPSYGYYKVPRWTGNRKEMDIYKIPQPVAVDISYEVRIFCNRMRDLNKFNAKVIGEFRSKQSYLSVNGHFMPITLESIGDESSIDSLDDKRYYVQLFDMKMAGYLLNEDEFKITPAVSKMMVMVEPDESIASIKPTFKCHQQGTVSNIEANFKVGSFNNLTIPIQFPTIITGAEKINIESVDIILNGNSTNLDSPLSVSLGDVIFITVIKRDTTKPAKLIFRGTKA